MLAAAVGAVASEHTWSQMVAGGRLVSGLVLVGGGVGWFVLVAAGIESAWMVAEPSLCGLLAALVAFCFDWWLVV